MSRRQVFIRRLLTVSSLLQASFRHVMLLPNCASTRWHTFRATEEGEHMGGRRPLTYCDAVSHRPSSTLLHNFAAEPGVATTAMFRHLARERSVPTISLLHEILTVTTLRQPGTGIHIRSRPHRPRNQRSISKTANQGEFVRKI